MAQICRGQSFTLYSSSHRFMPFTPSIASHPWLTYVEHPLNATYQTLQKELWFSLDVCLCFGRTKHLLSFRAPSLEAIPVRSLIIRQGQQLINSSSAVSPLCFLMAPAYVLDAVWLGSSACWLFYFVFSASSLLTRPYTFVIWSPAHLSYFASRSFELSFSGVSAHSFKKKRVAVQSTILWCVGLFVTSALIL